MRETVAIQPSVIRWAVQRSNLGPDVLASKFPKINEWQGAENARLSFVELEKLSSETHIPMGFFFLKEPPPEEVPLPDFRTIADKSVNAMSMDLVDTIHAMQIRQAWCSNFAKEEDWPKLRFVGSSKASASIKSVAKSIASTLALESQWNRGIRDWAQAVSMLREKVEAAGVLIVLNGCVGNNTHRTLDPKEFRGFVISDEWAPLIFVNGQDSKAAQMFTIVHELAHLWIGRTGIVDANPNSSQVDASEQFCNSVAAEMLVPEDDLKSIWYDYQKDADYQRLARLYKVSSAVIARRLFDLELVPKKTYFSFLSEQKDKEFESGKSEDKSGGSFYNNQNFRIGKRFMRIVGRAAEEGKITYTEAYRLTGLNNITFERYLNRISGIR